MVWLALSISNLFLMAVVFAAPVVTVVLLERLGIRARWAAWVTGLIAFAATMYLMVPAFNEGEELGCYNSYQHACSLAELDEFAASDD